MTLEIPDPQVQMGLQEIQGLPDLRELQHPLVLQGPQHQPGLQEIPDLPVQMGQQVIQGLLVQPELRHQPDQQVPQHQPGLREIQDPLV